MGTLQGIKALFASFTAFPVKEESTHMEAANYLPLVPLIGSVTGLLVATVVGVFRLIFPAVIAGILGLGFLVYVNGLRYTSGLIGFGKGSTHKGFLEEKNTMSNGNAGGFVLTFVVLLATALSIANLDPLLYFQDIIVAETSAKFAMVALAWMGRSVAGESVSFVEKMRGSRRGVRIVSSLTISLAIGVFVLSSAGLFVVLIGFLTAIMLTWLAGRSFGGVTQAVFWAANDISRLTCLLAIMAIS